MKQVITALANPMVNRKLKEYKQIQVIANDIQYQEGILELLEQNNKIDCLILSQLLPGAYSILQLVETIQEINKTLWIIIILEKENKELENVLLAKGKTSIFYNNQIRVIDLIETITKKQEKEKLEQEIENLKKMVEKEKGQIVGSVEEKIDVKRETIEESQKIEQEIETEYEKNKTWWKIAKQGEKRETMTICITGVPGIGKSVFAINLAKVLKKMKKKVLIIDLDSVTKSILTLLGKSSKQTKIVEQNGIQVLEKNEKSEEEINKFLQKKNQKYDNIIIDTPAEWFQKEIQQVMEISNQIIFLTEANIIQLKKSKKILEFYQEKWKIPTEKIKIVLNKNQGESIDFEVLKEIFNKTTILGKIDFIENYNALINYGMKESLIEKKIKKEYYYIGKKILRKQDSKQYLILKIGG